MLKFLGLPCARAVNGEAVARLQYVLERCGVSALLLAAMVMQAGFAFATADPRQCILEAGNGSTINSPCAGQPQKFQHISSGSWPLSTRGSPQLTNSTVSHTRANA